MAQYGDGAHLHFAHFFMVVLRAQVLMNMKYCEAVPQLLAHAGDNAVGAIFGMEEEEDVEV